MNFKWTLIILSATASLLPACSRSSRKPTVVQAPPTKGPDTDQDAASGRDESEQSEQGSAAKSDGDVDAEPSETPTGDTGEDDLPDTGGTTASPSPSPTATKSPSPTPSPSPTKSPTPSPSPSANGKDPAPEGWNGETDVISPKTPWRFVSLEPSTTVDANGGLSSVTNPIGSPSPGPGGTAVTYRSKIQGILDRQCVSCHGPNGQRSSSPLNSYANARANGSQSVSRVANGTMPTNGPLSAADVQAFQAWQTGGFQE